MFPSFRVIAHTLCSAVGTSSTSQKYALRPNALGVRRILCADAVVEQPGLSSDKNPLPSAQMGRHCNRHRPTRYADGTPPCPFA